MSGSHQHGFTDTFRKHKQERKKRLESQSEGRSEVEANRWNHRPKVLT